MGDEQRAEATQARRRGPFFFVLVAALAALLYVLSIGPALYVYVVMPSSLSPKAFTSFYAPVIWLHDNTALEKPLEAYVDVWRKLGGRRVTATRSTSKHP